MPTPMIIDSDTASDDAVAIAMALRHPGVEVLAITTVAGNCSVEQATSNAIYTAELCGSEVPVHVGAANPLLVPPAYATWFHGEDGLGDQGYPPPTRRAETEDAASALIRLIDAHPGCTLVTLGPLTNIAVAIRQAPEIIEQVGRCVVMGGTANAVGNVTPAAEFNLWFDPHAARAVFSSGLPLEMVGWEVCRGAAGLDDAEQAQLKALGDLGTFFVECNATAMEAARKQSDTALLELPDPTAMAVALDKSGTVSRASSHFVEIEAESTLTRGMSVVDALNVTDNEPNVEVVWQLNPARFKAMVFAAAG